MREILHFINPDNYLVINRNLAKGIGPIPTIVLAEMYRIMMNTQEFKSSPKHGDGFFYFDVREMEDHLGIARTEIEHALERLAFIGMIKMNVIGFNNQRHYKLLPEIISEIYTHLTKPVDQHTFRFDIQNLLTESKALSVKRLKEESNKIRTKDEFRYKKKQQVKGENQDIAALGPYDPDAKKGKGSTFENDANKKLYIRTTGDTFLSIPKKNLKRKSQFALIPNVYLANEEYKALVQKFGQIETFQAMQKFGEWKKIATDEQMAEHECDFNHLIRWVIPEVQKELNKTL